MSNSPTCDVLVAGGGVAGIPAAVAAARAGARTILVERESFLGGTGVTALHRYLCGLYVNGPREPRETLNPGLSREIADRLRRISPASRPLQMDRSWGIPFEPCQFRRVYETLAGEQAGLTRLTGTVEAVTCDGGRIAEVTVQTLEEEKVRIRPRAVIDATGTGAVIRLSGAPSRPTPVPKQTLHGFTMHLEGIEGDRQLLPIKIAWQLGRLPSSETAGLPFFGGFAPGCGERDGYCRFNFSLERAEESEAAVRVALERVRELLAAHLPELRASRIVRHFRAFEPGGVRLAGEWELDEATILQARKFPNSVARNAWPVEFWHASGGGPFYAYPPDDDYYEIPRRCLYSRSVANLFAAGRCISVTDSASASIRTMGISIALGEAAGKLAAIFR